MVLHSQIEGVMLPANNISTPPDRSLSAQARRGMGPGQSSLAAMFVTYLMPPILPKMPSGGESGLQAPRRGLALAEGRFARAEPDCPHPASHTTAVQSSPHWHSVCKVQLEGYAKTMERAPESFRSMWVRIRLGKISF